MGQYFQFYNLTRNVKSTVPVHANMGLHWACKMEKYPENNRAIFEQVIRDNKWDVNDDIEAVGDYDDVISWKDYKDENVQN